MTEFEQAVLDKRESIENAVTNNTEQLQLVNQRLEMLGSLNNSMNSYSAYNTYILLVFLAIIIAYAFVIYISNFNK